MREQHIFPLDAWPVWNFGADSGRRRLTGGIVPALFLVWLAEPVVDRPAPAVIVVAVLYAVGYLAVFRFGARAGPRARAWLVTWLFATGTAFALIAGPSPEAAQLVYAIVAAVVLLPLRWSVPLGLLTTAAALAVTWPETGAALALGLTTLGAGLLFLLARSLIMLREANERIAALAAAQERDRLARDVHDVLGHTLTTITAKLGLARRLIETGAERERELAEIHDAERLSRQALAEIRATLSGYRRASLAAELAGARAALNAAGISPLLPHAVDEVPEVLREPFAYVVREGVTNVIRHSGASRCQIRLGPSWLEVRDNGGPGPATLGGGPAASGAGPAALDGGPAASGVGPATPGGGLSGLAERLAEAGARLEAGPIPGGGFRLMARLP